MHADAIRNINATRAYASQYIYGYVTGVGTLTGAFAWDDVTTGWWTFAGGSSSGNSAYRYRFDASRVVPTGPHTAPRAYGSQTLVYLGS